jgi:carboxymethylenebutenolidase
MDPDPVAPGHLVHPEAGPHPGVVMIHDVWGLSDHTRDLAGRLAREGFAVLAVDLYRRLGDLRIDDPGAFMRGLSDPDVLADIQAGIDTLARHPAVGGCRVGVTGFCMGGTYALLAACSCRGLSAAVPFYGLLSHEHGLLHAAGGVDPERKPRQPLDAVSDLRCPLLAFFGEDDEYVPLADVELLKRRLARVEWPSDVVVYPGAGHAFMNDTRRDAYRPGAASDAWLRLVRFLRERLAD